MSIFFSSLFCRFKQILQESLQIHFYVGLLQRLKHHLINAYASQRQGVHITHEGCCL